MCNTYKIFYTDLFSFHGVFDLHVVLHPILLFVLSSVRLFSLFLSLSSALSPSLFLSSSLLLAQLLELHLTLNVGENSGSTEQMREKERCRYRALSRVAKETSLCRAIFVQAIFPVFSLTSPCRWIYPYVYKKRSFVLRVLPYA